MTTKLTTPPQRGSTDKKRKGPSGSSWVVRMGKPLRRYINPKIRQYSKVGDAPVLDRERFPWISDLEDNWESIRMEAEQILRFSEAIPSISSISPDHKGLDDQKKWRSYFMWGYGFKSDKNSARCPQTTKLVEAIPGLSTALFSIHEPGMTIKPHKGVTAGVCVFHLGLIIPQNRDQVAIRVEDAVYHWREGEGFIFDDTYEHETWNNTDERRVILLLHVKRPTRFPGSVLAALFMAGIRRTSFIQDALNAMQHWETAFSALENESAE